MKIWRVANHYALECRTLRDSQQCDSGVPKAGIHEEDVRVRGPEAPRAEEIERAVARSHASSVVV